MLDEKDLQAIDQLMAHRMNIILESEISPKLNLLAEGMEILQEKMAPRSRVDELDEEIKFLKLMVRQMNERINNLEKDKKPKNCCPNRDSSFSYSIPQITPNLPR